MRSHLLVMLVLAFATAIGCGGPAARPPERVLLVTIDTLRADHVGCYGASGAHTPHLDTVAAQGVRFEVALAPAPLTLPSHTSLMTGLEPPVHGVRHNSIHQLVDGPPTLAEQMARAGYATGAAVGALVLDHRFGLARGFDTYDDRMQGRRSGTTGYPERRADAVVDAALAWLDGAPERFFLWVHFYDPHVTYDPPPGFASAFANERYAGEIAFADAEFGRLLAGVRKRWGDQGLLLVVTSDHGESLGAHGESTHSYGIYEATQRIPLLMSGPGLPAGRVAPGPASLVDVAPTILALTSAEPLPGATGRDLRTLLERPDEERSVYMETLATWFDFGWSPLFGVRSGKWKYIRAPRPELYDLESDPEEGVNLASERPELSARLDGELARHLDVRGHEAASVELSGEERAGLRSLGYVVPAENGRLSSPGAMEGPDPKLAIRLLRQVAQARKELEEGHAAEALARLRALGDAATTVRVHRAAAALSVGEVDAAERDARAVLEAEPARADMRVLLARALLAQDREVEAGEVLAAMPPGWANQPWVALRAAASDAAAGLGPRAIDRLALARERYPDSLELASAHAGLLESAGRLEEALAVREAAYALAPESARVRNDLAWNLALLGRDADRALRLAEGAVEAGGEEPELLDTLATVLLAGGDPARARAVVDRALVRATGPTREHLLELRARTPRPAGSRGSPEGDR